VHFQIVRLLRIQKSPSAKGLFLNGKKFFQRTKNGALG